MNPAQPIARSGTAKRTGFDDERAPTRRSCRCSCRVRVGYSWRSGTWRWRRRRRLLAFPPSRLLSRRLSFSPRACARGRSRGSQTRCTMMESDRERVGDEAQKSTARSASTHHRRLLLGLGDLELGAGDTGRAAVVSFALRIWIPLLLLRLSARARAPRASRAAWPPSSSLSQRRGAGISHGWGGSSSVSGDILTFFPARFPGTGPPRATQGAPSICRRDLDLHAGRDGGLAGGWEGGWSLAGVKVGSVGGLFYCGERRKSLICAKQPDRLVGRGGR